MPVPTEEIPQANSLVSLREVVEAVSAGALTTAEIETAAHLKPRHVRYYLLAAQTLGWIDLTSAHPSVTKAGVDLLATRRDSLEECEAIAQAINRSSVLSATVGSFLDDESVDQRAMAKRLLASTKLSKATALRRAASLASWRTQLLDRGWTSERIMRTSSSRAALPVGGLSVRARGVLTRLGVKGPADVGRLSVDSLRRTHNCGLKTTKEILAWVDSLGVPLKGISPETLSTGAPAREQLISEAVNELPVGLLMDVGNLDLSTRARRCLERHGVKRLGGLVTLNEAALRSGEGCGLKTINELRNAVRPLGFSLGMTIPTWSSGDADELARRRASDLTRIERRLRKQLYQLDSSRGLETEIRSCLATIAKDSARPKVELWLGLDQEAPPTLQRVADAGHITRERVRQIVERTQRKVHTLQLNMPRLRGAIAELEKAKVLSDRAAQQLLIALGLAEASVSMRGLLRAAEFFGISTRLRWSRVGVLGFVGLPKPLTAVKAIRRTGRRAVERWGCATIEDVAAELTSKAMNAVTPDLVRDVLLTQSGFSWLDEQSGWFWLKSVPRNRLLNKIDKILAAASQVDLSVLRAGVARSSRMEGFSPPTRVLRALCKQLEDCEVVGGQVVVDKRPRRIADELSQNEQTMLEVFKKYGPVLSYADARQRCIDAGINETTTSIYLGTSPIVRRLAIGVYTVVGIEISPGEIDAVAKAVSLARQSRVMQDYGWSPDGKSVWASYKISESMLRSGVVGIPAGIKRYLSDDGYELRGADGARIGRIGLGGGNMWGLLPFFRRRGGEPGDYLMVSFNLSERTALGELSEEAVEVET